MMLILLSILYLFDFIQVNSFRCSIQPIEPRYGPIRLAVYSFVDPIKMAPPSLGRTGTGFVDIQLLPKLIISND